MTRTKAVDSAAAERRSVGLHGSRALSDIHGSARASWQTSFTATSRVTRRSASQPSAAVSLIDFKATRVEGAAPFLMQAILAAVTWLLILTISDGRVGTLSAGSVFTNLGYVLLIQNKTVGLCRSVVRVGRVLASAERIAARVRAIKQGSAVKRSPPSTIVRTAHIRRTTSPSQLWVRLLWRDAWESPIEAAGRVLVRQRSPRALILAGCWAGISGRCMVETVVVEGLRWT